MSPGHRVAVLGGTGWIGRHACATFARHGYGVYVDNGQVDVVRSGTVTPTANCAIGMTYLPLAQAKPGTAFTIDVRGRRAPAEVVALPFVPRKTK